MEPGQSLGARAVATPVEDDQRFIGARMVADFLAMDGWDVDFLGNGTPFPAGITSSRIAGRTNPVQQFTL